jgi:hypothetical protein
MHLIINMESIKIKIVKGGLRRPSGGEGYCNLNWKLIDVPSFRLI